MPIKRTDKIVKDTKNRSTWAIQHFPIKLRKKFIAHARKREVSAAEYLEQIIRELLKNES
jgi:hypothetical protein